MNKLSSFELLTRYEQASKAQSSLLSPMERDALLIKILVGAKMVTEADAGTLYLVENEQLTFQILLNDRLNITHPKDNHIKDKLNPLPLFASDGQPNRHNVATAAFHDKKVINVSDAYTCQDYDFTGTLQADKTIGYKSKSFLAVPVINYKLEVIAVLQLINRIDEERKSIVTFNELDQKIAESYAKQALDALQGDYDLAKTQDSVDNLKNLLNDAKKNARRNPLPFLTESVLYALQHDCPPSLSILDFDDKALLECHLVACLMPQTKKDYCLASMTREEIKALIKQISDNVETIYQLLNNLHYATLTAEQQEKFVNLIAILGLFKSLTLTNCHPLTTRTAVIEAMVSLAEANIIDPAIFDYFSNNKLYRRYVNKFLDPEQR